MPSFDDDVGHVLRDACLYDADDEAICLAMAPEITRRDYVWNAYRVLLFLTPGLSGRCWTKSLVALVSMIMDGLNVKKRNTYDVMQATLSLAQLCRMAAPRIDWFTP